MIYREPTATGNFVQVNKNIVNNPKLSLASKGLLTYMLSKANDWKFFKREIQTNTNCGQTAIKNYMNELIDQGYVTEVQGRNAKGLYDYTYDVYENPKRNMNFQEGKLRIKAELKKKDENKTEDVF